MQAYADIGIRARVSLDQPNVVEHEKYPYLRDILPAGIRRRMEAAPLQSDEELEAIYRWFIGKWNNVADGRLSTAVSCSAPQRVTPNYLKILHGLSQEHDLPYYIHTLETKLQRVLGAEKYGKSLIQYLGDAGVLDQHRRMLQGLRVICRAQAPAHQHDLRACLGETQRERPAHAAAGAGNNRNLAFEVFHCLLP